MTRLTHGLVGSLTSAAVILVASSTASALAAPTQPEWSIFSSSEPGHLEPGSTVPGSEHNDFYEITVTNQASVPSYGTITVIDKLPAGIKVGRSQRSGPEEWGEGTDDGVGSTYPANQEYEGNASEGAYRAVDIGREPEGDPPNLFYSYSDQEGGHCATNYSGTEASCTYTRPLGPGANLSMFVTLEVPSEVEGKSTERTFVTNYVTVSGGGGRAASNTETAEINSQQAEFGLKTWNVSDSAVGGLSDTQAGDHPYEAQVAFMLNTEVNKAWESVRGEDRSVPQPIDGEEVRDFVVELPEGLVGDPEASPKCPLAVFDAYGEQCPRDTQIGTATGYVLEGITEERNEPESHPVYNVQPEPGEPADFQLKLFGFPINLKVTLTAEANYKARVIATGIPRIGELVGLRVTLFGTPATNRSVYNFSTGGVNEAFLTNPTDCSAGAEKSVIYTDSWTHPGKWLPNGQPEFEEPAKVAEGKPDNWKKLESVLYPSMVGCELLKFEPTLTVIPNVVSADEPTGVKVDVHIPQARNAWPDLQTPELKQTTVTLPEGVSLSPSAADGLEGCTNEQIDLTSTEPGRCKNGSVLGTTSAVTPLLTAPLTGHVYLGDPECNPCNSADAADGKELRLFIELAGDGVRVKKEGRIYANPSTGQLTTRFEQTPELPLENIELLFKSGLRAGLATPQECGTFTTTTDLVPWSSPITPDASPQSPFTIGTGPNGGPCPSVTPLKPSFSAGTSNSNAGQFSPLTVTFTRKDGEQNLAAIQVKTPPGLLGMLSSIKLCTEPQAALGTCPEESKIGEAIVGAGPGAHPLYKEGLLYLTGPYNGAPFGLSIVVPTKAGPFNLGNVVVRAAITVDPLTAALTVTTDPLPQIIDGIPLRLRFVNLSVNRPSFVFNPTDCSKMQITGTVTGAKGARASVEVPFAVAGCHGLQFDPHIEVETSGHTSRTDGVDLVATLANPPGPQSNISRAQVQLPGQLPSRLTTLQKACRDRVFEANPSACPPESKIGYALVRTPVLPVPLEGPAIFVGHGDETLPSLALVLQGDNMTIALEGDTDIAKGVTSLTFNALPDVPFSSFEMTLPDGPYSALAANGNLCAEAKTVTVKKKVIITVHGHRKWVIRNLKKRVPSSPMMPTTLVGQNGAEIHQMAPISVTGCPTPKPPRTLRKAG